jgi:hypothetical protein
VERRRQRQMCIRDSIKGAAAVLIFSGVYLVNRKKAI